MLRLDRGPTLARRMETTELGLTIALRKKAV